MKRPERAAAVDKIEDRRKPEDFIGHRNGKTHWIQVLSPVFRKKTEYAGMMKLVNIQDLGSCAQA